ncbi:MAG TPA: carbon-nitrogen family hydrolase [Nocardioidaceae bacterium]|nr:carbon-nitrogen family hydrolase [Nocardioidaceae bacterium]
MTEPFPGATGTAPAATALPVTCAQLDGRDGTYDARVAEALATIGQAADAHRSGGRDAGLVVLPELWPVGFFHFRDYERSAEPLDGPVVSAVCAQARQSNVWVLGGSFVERSAAGLHNTTFLASPEGEVALTYRKIHLFGYQSAEAELLVAGDRPACVSTPFGRVGAMTCYDLRFPELSRAMVDGGAEIILVTSAWPAARIEHWRVLLRARAVENQVWIVAANTAGSDAGTVLGGHSAIVAPDGEVLAEGGGDAEHVSAVIDATAASAVRRDLPFLQDRRFRVHLSSGESGDPR